MEGTEIVMSAFLETDILLAALNDDINHCVSLIGELLSGERRTLAEAAREVAYQCDMVEIEKYDNAID